MTEIKNAVTIVTGASKGIGKELATVLAQRGARLALLARDENTLAAVAAELTKNGADVLSIPADVSKREQVESAFDKINRHFGAIDILVNNAGIGLFQPIAQSNLADVEAVLSTNLYGTLYCTVEALKYMRPKRRGHIVNISSIIGKHSVYHQGIYAASKAAIDRLTESLQAEERPNGIKTLLVIPDRTATSFREHVVGDRTLAVLPGGKMRELTPTQVAEGVVKAIESDRLVHYSSAKGVVFSLLSVTFPAIIRKVLEPTHD